jgi:hypothetical protein
MRRDSEGEGVRHWNGQTVKKKESETDTKRQAGGVITVSSDSSSMSNVSCSR